MRLSISVAVLICLAGSSFAQQDTEGPTNEKAQKTYREASEYLQKHMNGSALEDFKKADKQDGGHCMACQKKMIKYGISLGDWKTAEQAANELVLEAKTPTDLALAHYEVAIVLMDEGMVKRKDEFYSGAHDELAKALGAVPNFPDAIFADGEALAHLKQDDAAKAQFERFVKMKPEDNVDRQRALRLISRPELARARMAPPFAVTTIDGQNISLDNLNGRVVLIDFWATWCQPCREAMPHVRDLARKFQGQPLVVLSVSLDNDQKKWRDFVEKNGMTWPQYYDGGFSGPVAQLFGVHAIPNTFTIDSDGVLQDEHIGDASIEGKLKKLVERTRDMQSSANKPGQ